MLKGLVLIFILFVMIFTPIGRFIPFNMHNIIHYAPLDFLNYFKFKRYNECKNYGYIKVYNGYFGSGKTLSAVNEVINIYKNYNNRDIWIDSLECFVKQRITIVSNITLSGVPYVPFESEKQFIDYEVAIGEVVIFLIDEIGTVWNNRNFKSFNPDVFNNIVQSRKRKMAIYGTLPKLVGTDINVRRFTDDVVVCTKSWRILKQRYYKADDIENCSNIEMLEPHRIEYKFVTNRMYKQYDTNYMVDKLKKDMADGKLLTYNELSNLNDGIGDFRLARVKKKYNKYKK